MSLLMLVPALLKAALAGESYGGATFYLGDLHSHTGASRDGGSSDLGMCPGTCGSVRSLGEIAQTNGLDFFAVSDHSNGEQAASATGFDQSLQALLDADDPEAGFITIPSAEVWFQTPSGRFLGHRNPLLFGETRTLRQLAITDLQPGGTAALGDLECEDIWTWMEGLNERFGPALLVPHHPALQAPMPVDWTCHSPQWEPGVEVYSRHGSSMGDDLGMDPPWSGTVVAGTVHHALSEAGGSLQLGFLGGTDSHDTEPGATCDRDSLHTTHPYGGGLTVVMLPEGEPFTRQAIYDAIVERRTAATTGPLLPATVTYSSGGAYLGGVGANLGLPGGQPLDLRVTVPDDYAAHVIDVELVSTDSVFPLYSQARGVWTISLEPEEVPSWGYVRVTLSGETWYGDPGCNDGGNGTNEYVWFSPSWIQSAPPDLDKDGSSWADGDCDDGDPERSPDLSEDCTGGIDEDCDDRVDQADSDCRVVGPTTPTVQAQNRADLRRRHDQVVRPQGSADQLPLPQRPSGCSTSPDLGTLSLSLVALAMLRRKR